jgi:hypothetical protein
VKDRIICGGQAPMYHTTNEQILRGSVQY